MKSHIRRNNKEEAEKPFWISFSDMMTALMVLFLVAMTVALMAITNKYSDKEKKDAEREAEIAQLMERIEKASKEFPGMIVKEHTIDFGTQALFDTNSNQLKSQQKKNLRAFVPHVLAIARDPLGEKWLKRVLVDGFADQRGTYLNNLNLSMQRSERVLCVLFAKPEPDQTPFSNDDLLKIRELFLVGGSSFNALKSNMQDSRRIEFRLEFYERDDERRKPDHIPLDDGRYCPLD